MLLTLPPEQVVTALRHLYPGLRLLNDAHVMVEGSQTRLVWLRQDAAPTAAALEAALPAAQAAAQARAELAGAQAMLDERYRLYTRALANGNEGAQAEIKDEIQMILAYLQEVRDALSPA